LGAEGNTPAGVRESGALPAYHRSRMARTRTDDVEAITVLIADDHLAFGEAMELALAHESDLEVIGVVTDGDQAVDAVRRKSPDIVLMDAQMPGTDGFEATRAISDEGAGTQVIVLTGQDDEVGLARAVQAGARAYLQKTEAVVRLADAVRAVHRGEPLHAPEDLDISLRQLRRRSAVDQNLARRLERLTPRELQILQRMTDGMEPEEIAEELGMSRHTLRTHVQNVITKLGVHSKMEAVIAAIRYGKVATSPRMEPEAESPQGSVNG